MTSITYSKAASYKVGETFTLQSKYFQYPQAILWQWDTNILEPTTKIYETTDAVTFKVKQASPLSGTIVTATTYYYKSNTTSSGVNKYFQDWKILTVDRDNTGNDNTGGGNTGGSQNDSKVKISPINAKVQEGKWIKMVAIVDDSYNGGYSWRIHNINLASYTKVGAGGVNSVLVRGDRPGETSISVTLDNGAYYETTLTITAIAPPPTKVRLKNEISLYQGASYTLVPTLEPSNAEVTYTWNSDDTSVVSVSSSGTLTAKKEGIATITVTTNNGLKATTLVTVTKLPANMTESTINKKISIIENLINNTFNKAY